MRARAKELPDDFLVCLVGDMITEEALPTYQTMFNTFEGVRDKTGSSPTPWGVWIRAWTAEENRHGDLLNRYLYLSGRVDMRMVERTTQYLIGSGMVRSITLLIVRAVDPVMYTQYLDDINLEKGPTTIGTGDFEVA